jgi:hypothetical protein
LIFFIIYIWPGISIPGIFFKQFKINFMTEFNNDLLIKNNPADLVLLALALNYDGTEKSVSILIDSAQNWPVATGGYDDNFKILGFWGSMVISWLEHDTEIKCLVLKYYQVVNGESMDIATSRPFLKDGNRFKQAVVNRDGTIVFSNDDK